MKDVKLFGYDFGGHTEGNRCSNSYGNGSPYYTGPAIFLLY